jgi:hypothetical protein
LSKAKETFHNFLPETMPGITPMHFFGAMVKHRLNPMLLADGQGHFWLIDPPGMVQRVPSSMTMPTDGDVFMVGEAPPEEAGGAHAAEEPVEDIASVRAGKRARPGEVLSWDHQGDDMQLGAFSKSAPERPSPNYAMWYLQARAKERPRPAVSQGGSSSG